LNTKAIAAFVLILVVGLAAGYGAGVMITGTHVVTQSMTATETATLAQASFKLTLMEIMDTGWNSTMAQPQFSVVGPTGTGLESSANIALPANTLIQLTIISYDTPTAGSTDAQGKVSGTVGGTVYLVNGTSAMGTDVTQRWGQNVTSVPGAMLAHTFTIQALGINIPVVGGDTEIAYLYLTQTGTFQWVCLTPCGFGPTGMQGAMSTAGWMEGQVTVY
jgi:hypothetical protein